jgi:hypothetical protein
MRKVSERLAQDRATDEDDSHRLIELCPPHEFAQGWQDNDHGCIFCVACGDVRALVTPSLGPID